MYPQAKLIDELLAANKQRAVVASRDAAGVPHLSPEFIWHTDDDAVYFAKLPGSRTGQNLAAFPEASLSVVDWAGFRGLQLKGLATRVDVPAAVRNADVWRRLQGAGITEVYRLEVMEVFDVIPKSGADLSVALWWRKRYWGKSAKPPVFNTSGVAPAPMPGDLQARVTQLADMLRGRFVPAFVGTTGEDGVPNISPRFILEAGRDYWFYGDGFRNKTYVNVGRPSPLCIALIDWERERGLLAHGWAEFRFTGDWLEKIKRHWEAMKFPAQAIQAVVFHPEEVAEVGLARPVTLMQPRPRTLWLGQTL